MTFTETVNKDIMNEVLEILSRYPDRTLRQIGNELDRSLKRKITLIELYDILHQMNDMG